MGLYEELTAANIFEPIIGRYKIVSSPSGEPRVYVPAALQQSNPWIHTRHKIDRYCDLWNIYHQHYGIIPAGCRQCWKVVMAIPTVKQAFKVLEFQQSRKLPYNCKTGMEQRAFTGKIGKFGAYWYAPLDGGLEGGRKMLQDLQSAFPGVKLLLKRGCTEFEMVYSPSDEWDVWAEKNNWDQIEHELSKVFVSDAAASIAFEQDKRLEVDTLKKWIEFAAAHGDETYREFIDGSLTVGYLQYNSSKHKNEDFEAKELPKVQSEVLHGYQDWVENHYRPQNADRENASSGRKVALISEL